MRGGQWLQKEKQLNESPAERKVVELNESPAERKVVELNESLAERKEKLSNENDDNIIKKLQSSI